jgi:hypothetical protein
MNSTIIFVKVVQINKTEFSRNTTNSSDVRNLFNISNLMIGNPEYGLINFLESTNLSENIDLDEHINISFNRIEINTSNLIVLNKSAKLWLYNLTFTNPRILRDGVVCPSTICTKESYSSEGTLKFNVTGFTVYSAEETPSEAQITTGGGGGGGASGIKLPPQCTDNKDCSKDEICWRGRCTQLFDVKITDFKSPVELGSFFEFTYFLKGMATINDDVNINFWIEKQGEKVTSGSDVIYLGSFEEKTETTKIFLPSTLESGVYEFYVEVYHQEYQASSHRTIEIIVKEGIAEIKFRESEEIRKYALIIIGILSVLTIFIIAKNLIKKKSSTIQAVKESTKPKEQIIKKETIKERGKLKEIFRRIFEIFGNLGKIIAIKTSNLFKGISNSLRDYIEKLKQRREDMKIEKQKEQQKKIKQMIVPKPATKKKQKESAFKSFLENIKLFFLKLGYELKLVFIRIFIILKNILRKKSTEELSAEELVEGS